MKELRVVLVDDHPPLRAGVAAILDRSDRYHVVGEAGTIAEADEVVRSVSPDVVVVDISLPDGSGLDFVRRMTREAMPFSLLVLSMHARHSVAESAFEAGAQGYLLKESTGEHLIDALDRIVRGEIFLDDGLGTLESAQEGKRAWSRPMTGLSDREYEVFRLLASGQNSKQIAAVLGISSKTVDNHRSRIMEKLGLDSIADLVRTAIRAGAIDP